MPQVTVEIARSAYNLFFGRDPENDLVLQQALSYGTVEKLRTAFLTSDEFQSKLPRVVPRVVPLDAPKIVVEWDASADSIVVLLGRVKKEWTQLGQDRPYWSVLSSESFKPEYINENKAAFFASGKKDRDDLVAILDRQGIRPADLPLFFEFGCGIGRVTTYFAEVFSFVEACDVSSSHIALAREVVANSGLNNMVFSLVEDENFGMFAPFNIWYSRIVLQHNPPPIMAMILKRALFLLALNGIAVFQIPTYAVNYEFRLSKYLSNISQKEGIEMHVLLQSVIFEIVSSAGCKILEVLEDFSAGPSSDWNSTTFVVQKIHN